MKRRCIFRNGLVLCVIFFTGCKSKKVLIDKEYHYEKLATKKQNDTLRITNLDFTLKETTQVQNKLVDVLKILDVTYDGTQENNLSIRLSEVEGVTELVIEGKGKANYRSADSNKEAASDQMAETKKDSFLVSQSMGMRLSENKQILNTLSTNKIVKTTGWQFGTYIMGTIILMVIILLLWFYFFVLRKY